MSGVFAQAVDRKILDFIHHSLSGGSSEESFNQLALEIFAYQFAHNMAYRMFCLKREATPDRIFSWEEIPAASTAAFKSGSFGCFLPSLAVRAFETSGTTAGKRGKHFFDSLTLYDESAIPNFGQHLLPDGANLPMRILLPSPEEAPASSLVYMCKIVSDAFSVNTEWYIRGGKFNVDALVRDLEMSVENGEPRMLLGPSFAFVHLFDSLAKSSNAFRLVPGSRMMETGGYKGKSREVAREEFLKMAEQFLGIPPEWVVNEYGMTELTSQMYDDTIRRRIHTGAGGAPVKIPPPWMRARIVDPLNGEPAAPGVPGLIRLIDLANRGSAIAVQTEDVGVQESNGIRVIGRIRGADPRGCSRAVDELLSS